MNQAGKFWGSMSHLTSKIRPSEVSVCNEGTTCSRWLMESHSFRKNTAKFNYFAQTFDEMR